MDKIKPPKKLKLILSILDFQNELDAPCQSQSENVKIQPVSGLYNLRAAGRNMVGWIYKVLALLKKIQLRSEYSS